MIKLVGILGIAALLCIVAGSASGEPPSDAKRDSTEMLLSPDTLIEVDSMPEMIRETRPEYPKQDREKGLQGTLWVKALVGSRGDVLQAVVLKREKGSPAMEQSAIDAAMKNKFKPAVKDGTPVAIWVTYKVAFVLSDK